MLDETIAAMKKEYRKRKREDQQYQEDQEQNQLLLEELKIRMKRGKIIFPNQILDISYEQFCEGQLKIPVAANFFDSTDQDNRSFVMINQKYQCSLTGQKNPNQDLTMQQWRDETVQTLTQYFIFPEYIQQFQFDDREYISYLTHMPEGVFYNIAYRIFSKACVWSGSARCSYQNRSTLGLFLEAAVNEITG